MTARCLEAERWRDALSARLDGEASPLSDAELDRHLLRCPACAEWYAESQRVSAHLHCASPAGPDLSRQLIGATEAHICGCHHGEPCECTDCQCVDCTCGN